MKKTCVGLLVVCFPAVAFADETAESPDPERRGAIAENAHRDADDWERVPRLLIDNLVGFQLNGNTVGAFAGPFSASVVDSPRTKTSSFGVNLEVDGRVWKFLTLGGTLSYGSGLSITDRESGRQETKSALANMRARVGALVPLGKDLYFWPRLAPGLHATGGGAGPAISVTVDAPVLFMVHSHLFVGVGPRVVLSHKRNFDYDDLSLSFDVHARMGVSF